MLNIAVSENVNKCLKLLLEKGFDVNQLGQHIDNMNIKYSALEVAIMANKPMAAKFLVRNNAKFNLDKVKLKKYLAALEQGLAI